MPAYAIFHVDEIIDRERLKAYQQAAHPTVAEFGGKVIAAYGRQEIVEGPPLVGIVTIEFPSYEIAQAWYHSPGYSNAKRLREGAVSCRAAIVDGKP